MIPLLVRVDNLTTQTSSQYAFARSPVRIGRNPLNDLALEFPFVSQWHAVVQFDEQNTQYFDLGSTNGTTVNGARVGKNVPVPAAGNTEFRIGALRIYFARGPAPAHLLNQRSGPGTGPSFGSTHAPAGGLLSTMDPSSVGRSGEATVMFNPEATSAYDPESGGLPGASSGVANALGNVAQMRAIVNQVRPLYDAYRRSWKALYQGVSDILRTLPPGSMKLALAFIEREFPALGNEEDFRTLAQAQQVGLTGAAGVSHAAATLVTQMAQYFVPSNKSPETSAEVERMLVRVAGVLDAFSASFVALRKGYNQFGSEMALPHNRAGLDTTPLNSAQDPREVLAYLLDWTTDAQVRVQELTSAYADIMIHQVALLNGLMEGVRSLLQRLGPAEIEREAATLPVKLGPITVPRFLWPFRASAKWQRYVQRHRELTEEDREITSAVFGAEFARAYAGVVGENFTETSPKRLNDPSRR